MSTRDSLVQLGDYIKSQRQQAKVSLRQLAELADVSNPYLSQIERGLRKPSADILAQIAKGLRISAETLYVKAGLMDERTDTLDVEYAISSDGSLSEHNKDVLISVYRALRVADDESSPTQTQSQPQ